MRSMIHSLVLAASLVVCTGGGAAAQSTVDTVAAQGVFVDGMPLRPYHGDGFTVLIPAGASIGTGASYAGDSVLTIVGPTISMTGVWPGNAGIDGRRGPAYVLGVAVHSTLAGMSLDQTVDSIVKARNCDRCDSTTSYAVTLAGQRARVVQIPCGDCWAYEIYFMHRGRLVTFSYSTDDSDLLDVMSAPLYWLMINTFRWTTK